MAKKRPSKDSEEPNIQLKKVKESEFNGTVFKAFLREPAKAMFGESVACKLHAYYLTRTYNTVAFM